MFEANLIALYSFVFERYESDLQYDCWRRSNNRYPRFSDVEAITIYLYAVRYERRLRIREIYDFADRYLRGWFPSLPSYQAFCRRINWLSEALRSLLRLALEEAVPADCQPDQFIVDSLPIITCSSKRAGKVARNITAKGYCATKGFHYYGMKLHSAAFSRAARLPHPDWLAVTGAEAHDLTTFKEHDPLLRPGTYYGDKIYIDAPWLRAAAGRGIFMLTPVKLKQGDSPEQRQYKKAAEAVYSRAVSRVRQPIESLFNWLITHTDIQRASMVRSAQGLLVHIFGKLAALYVGQLLNP